MHQVRLRQSDRWCVGRRCGANGFGVYVRGRSPPPRCRLTESERLSADTGHRRRGHGDRAARRGGGRGDRSGKCWAVVFGPIVADRGDPHHAASQRQGPRLGYGHQWGRCAGLRPHHQWLQCRALQPRQSVLRGPRGPSRRTRLRRRRNHQRRHRASRCDHLRSVDADLELRSEDAVRPLLPDGHQAGRRPNDGDVGRDDLRSMQRPDPRTL